MRVICIYDNHIRPNVFIRNIIGDKTFGEVILKRKDIKSKFFDFIHKEKSINEVLALDHDWQISGLLDQILNYGSNACVVHIFSQFVVKQEESAQILLQKAPYILGNYLCLSEDQVPVAFMMNNISEYCNFVKQAYTSLDDMAVYSEYQHNFETITTDAFYNIGEHSNFLQYISGGFDARFFNSVKGDAFTVVKSSTDKRKIRAEYQFYHFLPDYMKTWFVMPYNYQESESGASYEMERYHMTDLAIRWVHGAITIDECDKLLAKVFHFINTRKKKEISKKEYQDIEQELYLDKLDKRISKMKSLDLYPIINHYISSGTQYDDLDSIITCYKKLNTRITQGLDNPSVSVIGHGDLCFSNMLFNKEADLLKLIDPKGAVEEVELWTNPYYDVAKLSHSICGRYDFFNNGLHHISLNGNLRFELSIDFDNREYKELFRKYVEKSGYSYEAVRIYEVSLFLSMLPLHMDNPQKVFGFILNAIDIMGELETCLIK